MNLDELKQEWAKYDDKLKSTADIDHDVIARMVKKRSLSVVVNIRKSYLYGMVMCGFYLLCFIALNIGNPFDYKYTVEFLPLFLVLIVLTIVMVILFRAGFKLRKLDFHSQPLPEYLDRVITAYSKSYKLLQWSAGTILFCCTILFPLTFIQRNIARSGMFSGLLNTFGLLIFLSLLFFVKKKIKRFNQEEWYSFNVIMRELKALRASAAELKE